VTLAIDEAELALVPAAVGFVAMWVASSQM
jgi:hypothetical protein